MRPKPRRHRHHDHDGALALIASLDGVGLARYGAVGSVALRLSTLQPTMACPRRESVMMQACDGGRNSSGEDRVEVRVHEPPGVG